MAEIQLTDNDFGVVKLDGARGNIQFDGETFTFENADDTTRFLPDLTTIINTYAHRTSDGQYIHGALQEIVQLLGGQVVSIPNPDNEDLPDDVIL